MNEPFHAREILRFKAAPRSCSYVEGETACMEHRLIVDIDPETYEELLMRGWRRFGVDFFRPACQACVKCRSLRVDVAAFKPTKSQRRIQQKNQHLRLIVQRPTVTKAHLALWASYHAFMQDHRGWQTEAITISAYAEAFLLGNFSFAREFLYFDSDRLVAIGLVDVLPHSLSSIYFFHDPNLRKQALGVHSVLTELDYAKQAGLPFEYLGYWISECQSSAYKSQYKPHDILTGFPDDDRPSVWTSPAPEQIPAEATQP